MPELNQEIAKESLPTIIESQESASSSQKQTGSAAYERIMAKRAKRAEMEKAQTIQEKVDST